MFKLILHVFSDFWDVQVDVACFQCTKIEFFRDSNVQCNILTETNVLGYGNSLLSGKTMITSSDTLKSMFTLMF
jgi:hypothetical protein